ncbi:hypothetical protein MesoLj131c_61870 [Mesorhizobium sp. 131-3-5]|uniref:hypothetical protein n=1 Tax=Mesorhizobium sp. 131-3-5 TaxID=2744520 RepID=UPI001925A072|nr:hypothetical protein [Mesorhizobium sp. 131-3-5]BCH11929.1 hypothetical protein MesoLj131c_61870 [Mesorhizobium sp. 131-3-5]
MKTLLLTTDTWDLVADTSGNIAVADDAYSLAQDAASAIRLFQGELYYDTTQGIPYFEQILGRAPPISLMKAYFNRAALTVPGVVKAQTFIQSWTDRAITGQVQVTDADGNTTAAGF